VTRVAAPAGPRYALLLVCLLAALPGPGSAAWATPASDEAPAPQLAPGADSRWPQLLAAQYTFIEQWQSELTSPYEGKYSLNPAGDHQATHTIGIYSGWAPLDWGQLYFDVEKFMGAGVSGATGLGGLTNGDVIREGAVGLKKEFYIARVYARFMLPLSGGSTHVERGQDQIAGAEATRRVELKVGWLTPSDDFDRNRYAGSARTQFLNWSLWQSTPWDFGADTRGYTDGFVLGYISPQWSLKYGMYRMPTVANGQTLETLNRARNQNLELTLSPRADSTIVRLLAYLNTARLGDYAQALANAVASGTVPEIAADAEDGRHKVGFGFNLEQPLADTGNTGVFMRLGWNDAHTEDFVFTEVDRLVSVGGQLSGARWRRSDDCLGLGLVFEGLSDPHRDYLAAGGSGFLLGDGALNYAHEQIFETYYRAQWSWTLGQAPLRLQLSPDFQYVQNPAFNHDRGPVRFYAVRLHLEY
jgi:hypothetical protein